ncbi:MAG: YceI family protein [Sphingomonadales bacterium]|nr:YceI family protein [Sphingomonadales bacterium]
MIKNFILIAAGALAMGLSACNNNASETTDPMAEGQAGQGADTLAVSSGIVEWVGVKPTGKHNGTFTVSEGQLFVENNNISAGEFTIDMNSLKVLDITDAEQNADLTGHLKSGDFFQTDSFPNAKFVISTVTTLASPDSLGNTHTIAGNLTLKGATKGVSFPAKVALADGNCTAECSLSIDRTQWGVVYGSKNIFKNLGDKFINDIVDLKIKLSAAAN